MGNFLAFQADEHDMSDSDADDLAQDGNRSLDGNPA